ncbi:hypothetical protein COLO4_27331 [Corchorus olitorius]|uniref:Uncharacterized protein n=1 Tax=Corchorus olitorius TaxID=93759 RepID=A0A1R3HS09_9ROSI|nr:hypothetical protein COLO4_27331 [Corchorus olitorius]
MTWIERSAVGFLSSFISHQSVQSNCDSSGISCYVRPLGGCSVLLTFENKDVMEFYLKEHESWFSTWFSSIKQCDGSLCSEDQVVWLILEAIPLQLWHDAFFMEIGNLWGSFVTVDDSTHRKCRFDLARVLVSVKRHAKIPSKIVVSHNGGRFEIPISTEPAQNFISLKSDKKILVAGHESTSSESWSPSDELNSNQVDDVDSRMNDAVEDYEEGGIGNSLLNEVEAQDGLMSRERDDHKEGVVEELVSEPINFGNNGPLDKGVEVDNLVVNELEHSDGLSHVPESCLGDSQIGPQEDFHSGSDNVNANRDLVLLEGPSAGFKVTEREGSPLHSSKAKGQEI